MRSLEEHLSPQELASLPVSPEALASGGFDYQQLFQHLQQCEACSSLAQTHWSLSRLRALGTSATGHEACPAENVWLEFSAGLRPEQSSTLLAHAASCDACAVALREAMDFMQSDQLEQAVENDQPIVGLASATPAWQRRIAAQMRSASVAASSPESAAAPAKLTLVQNLRRWSLWITMPVAAAILCAVAFTGFAIWRAAHPSEARLLAIAYNKQRTMALRIPGADPVPLASGTRGSQGLTDPTELIELRLRAQQHLDRTPNSPYWHQILGRVQLLQQDGMGARRNFEIAKTTDENLPDLLPDLAAAWFEIGEKTGNTEAYAEAANLYLIELQNLDDGKPHPTGAALLRYNLALCWERQNRADNALENLRIALSLERSAAWRKTIEAEIARLSAHSATMPTDGYEAALADAIEKLLPLWSNSPEARTRIAQVATLGVHHHDRWLLDWIAANHTAVSLEADQHLAASVASARAGEAQSALNEARRATDLYRQSNQNPGLIRAQYAEVYALQRLLNAHGCLQIAEQLERKPQIREYAWLQTQLLIEHGDCKGLTGDAAGTQSDFERGLSLSSASNLPGLHLRALSSKAWFLDSRGLKSAAWQADVDSLQLCAQMDCPPISQYQAIYNMVNEALSLRLQFVAAELMRTATHLAAASGDATIHAYALETLGKLAGRTGDYARSDQAFAEATALARSGKQAPLLAVYQADWRTDRAEILARKGQNEAALKMLQAGGPSLLSSDYQSGRLHYFTELAAIQRSTGRFDEALTNALAAVHQSEFTLAGLHSTAERELWSRQSGSPYEELVKVYLERGDKANALQVWERYRRTPYMTVPIDDGGSFEEPATTADSSRDRVLVLARVGENYVGLLVTVHPFRVLRTAVLGDSARLQQSATTFYLLCADRDSSLADIKAVGARLYTSLLQPFADQLSSARLLLEVDPSLAMLPFAALTTRDGAWLAASTPITILPAWWTLHPDSSLQDAPLTRNSYMVAVSGFAGDGGIQTQNPVSEATEIAHLFPHGTLLTGSSANLQQVIHDLASADIFHFSGHAESVASPQLLLVSTDAERSPVMDATAFSSVHLHSQLAVLAACNTTAADPDQIEKLPDLRDALLHSGVHAVVASNWDVDDRSTHSLMLAFYHQLLSGLPPARALQSAQNSLQAGGNWRHPYYWASFEIFSN